MIYGSVCSGIEAATVAWHPLGWIPAWFSEIKPFPCKVLKHHYPSVPNLGDMLKIEKNETFQKTTIDLLVGGTPCQSFSTAGLRGGLADARGNLALEFCRILAIKRPKWFLWENVPGVLSVNEGKDFWSLLQGFHECGYCCAWSILDAQFFGIPQRRRRVFVVGYLGNDWRPPAAVLFEPEGMRGNPSPGRSEREDIAGTLTNRTGSGRRDIEEASGNCMVVARGHGTMTTGQANAEILMNLAPTLNCNHEQPIVFPIIYDEAQITSNVNGANPKEGDPCPTLAGGSKLFSIMPMNSGRDYKAREVEVTQPLATQPGVSSDQGGDVILKGTTVRRLTPMECERLQGFPDSFTAIPGASDSSRYEAIGNSMAVPVMAFIGRQIGKYDKIFNV